MRLTHRFRTAIAAFCGRVDSEIPVEVWENPTEEIEDALKRDRALTIHTHGANGSGKTSGPKRAEENYLYSSRRFPMAITNVIPAPSHIPQGDYLFFSVPLGNDGSNMGFPSGFTLGLSETNIETASQVPQGKAFRMKQVGVSFNMEGHTNDLQQLCDAGSIVFTKQGGQWNLRHGPAAFWPGGMGISGYSQQQGVDNAHSGLADWKSARYLKIPRDIHNLENFNYVYHVDHAQRPTDGSDWTLSAFTEMRVWLWGLQMDKIPD